MIYDYLIKLIIVGNVSVGKSSIASRFQNDIFNQNYEITIGVEFYTKIIKVDNKKVKIQIWDTAGQETFRALIKSYYRGAAACLLVFDICDKKSFEDIKYWMKDVKDNSNQFIIFTLIGNKSDKIQDRQVSIPEALEFAEFHQLEYIETSAFNSRNIYNAFYITADKILDNIKSGKTPIIHNKTIKIMEEMEYDNPDYCNICC
jgi:Ras-related protein Rab-2A